jgi:hypothetical protein
MAVYYKLDDIDMIARQDGGQSWLFDRNAGGWVPDADNVLADRLYGEDGESLGACVEISEAEAQQALGRVEDGAQQ